MKTIKKLSVTLFALAIMIACFLSTTLTASALGYVNVCRVDGCTCPRYDETAPGAYICINCGHKATSHGIGDVVNTNAHTHSYGTVTWGKWVSLLV